MPNHSSHSLTQVETPESARLRTWLGLFRTFGRLQRRLEQALAADGVTLPQFDVLATLRFADGITQQELAERLLVSKGNVCGVLDRLERLGWVERRSDPGDRRANRLHVTSAGREKLEQLVPEHDELVLHLMRFVTDAQVKALGPMLEKLEKGLDTP